MKEYSNSENTVDVELDRRNWLRAVNAMRHGIEDIPDDEERGHADDLIIEVIDQADLSVVELIDLEAELRQQR